MNFEQEAERLKAIAHPQRLRIVELLNDCGEMNVSAICKITGLPQPTASQYLAVLCRYGWIARARKGTLVYYSVADANGCETLLRLLQICELE